MRTLTSILACLLLSCSQPGQSLPAPSPALANTHAPHRAHRKSTHVALIDTRTPEQAAQSACLSPTGAWRCPKLAHKTLLASSASSPIIPASWGVGNWYIDPANSSGCASDSNSGTSATCSAGGIGPIATFGELNVHRWGCFGNPTMCPRLRQVTTLHLLSSQPVSTSDVVLLTPEEENGANLVLVGTLSPVATFTLGTKTPKVRGNPGTLLQFTGFTNASLAVGQTVVNTTRSSSAMIEALNTGTATLTQPIANSTLTTVTDFPTVTEDDTWTAGDSVTVYTQPSISLSTLSSVSGQQTASSGQVVWLQDLHLTDLAGFSGGSNVTVSSQGWQIAISRVLVDPTILIESPDYVGSGYLLGSMVNGSAALRSVTAAGGAFMGSTLLYDFAALDADAYLIGGASANGPGFSMLGYTYLPSGQTLTVRDTAAVQITGVVGTVPSCQLYGAGTVNIAGANASVSNASTTTWASVLTVGALQINGATTGSKYAAGVWTDSVSLTSANLDTNGTLQNPNSGARFTNAAL